MARVLMAYAGMAYIVMAYIVMATGGGFLGPPRASAFIVMADTVMDDIVMA